MSNNNLENHLLKKITFLIDSCMYESIRYRVFNVIEGLIEKGIECNIDIPKDPDLFVQDYVDKSDILVIMKSEISDEIKLIIEKFKEKNIPVIFDVDDLVFEPESAYAIDSLNRQNTEKKNALISELYKMREVLEKSDYMTCSTDFLKRRGELAGKPSFVIKNTINKSQFLLSEKLLDIKTIFSNAGIPKEKVKIGYFSGTKTHQRDFEECSDALVEILSKNPKTELHIIGDLDLDDKFTKFNNRVFKDSFYPYLEMLEKLSQMDINIAPLELNNPYNEGKSELKIFEAALVQVPTVASSTDSYSRCIKDEINGFIASSKDEWIEKLSLLINNRQLRKTIAEKARKDFIEQFYINNVIDNIIETYESIIADYYKNKNLDLSNLYSYSRTPAIAEELFLRFCNKYQVNYTDYNVKNHELVSKIHNSELFYTLLSRKFKTDKNIRNKAKEFIENNRNKKICLYGAGLFAKTFIDSVNLSRLNIIGFVDGDPLKKGTKMNNYEIFSIPDLQSLKPDVLVITVLKKQLVIKSIENIKEENNYKFEIVSLFD